MSGRLIFSTEAWPERDRFAAWCEEIVRRDTRLEIATQDRSRFCASIELQRVGAINIAHHISTEFGFARTPSLIRDGDDALFVSLVERGAGYYKQRDDQKYVAGEAIIMDSAYCGNGVFASGSQFWMLKTPRRKIAALLPEIKSFGGMRLNRNEAARRLLFHYLDRSLDADLDFSGSAGQLYEERIVGLIALALGVQGEVRETIERGDLRAVRRAAILHEIGIYLHNPKLAPQAVSARLGITPRYLRKLLEETGKSFSEHLLDKRLERAAALFRDPQHRGTRIADIAYACGFGDLSYFNRVFRRRYGLTPSDLRAAALPDHS